MPRALLIANPISGRAAPRRWLPSALRLLEEAGWETELRETRAPGGAEEIARSCPPGMLLVAIGGDGTLHEVANGIADRELELGIIPAGTSNALARDLGIPRRWRQALEVIRRGRTRRIDLGEFTAAGGSPRRFVLCLGAGLDGEIIREMAGRRKGGLRLSSYLGPFWRSYRAYPFPELEVKIEGKPLPLAGLSQVVVANARTYGAGSEIARQARLDDGWLDLVLFTGLSRARQLRQLAALFLRLLAHAPGVSTLRAQELELSGSAPVQVDGEVGPSLPLRIRVLPGKLAVRAP